MDNVGQTLVSYLQQRILVTPKMDFGSAKIHLICVKLRTSTKEKKKKKKTNSIVALPGTLKRKSLPSSTQQLCRFFFKLNGNKKGKSINTRLPVLKKKAAEKEKNLSWQSENLLNLLQLPKGIIPHRINFNFFFFLSWLLDRPSSFLFVGSNEKDV